MSSPENENGVPPGQTPAPAFPASPTDRVSPADPVARRSAVSRWLAAGLVIAVIVIVALAATLRHQQQQLDNFGRESTRRLDTVVAAAEAARSQAAQAASQATAHESRLSGLDQRLLHLEEEQRTLAQ